MVDFKSLKKNSSLSKLTKALQNTNKNFGGDERYWQPSVDKAGNGFAIIRFLDSPFVDGDDGMPWAELFSHGFQGPGGWYIENSLTTIGQKDPVSEENSRVWKLGGKANEDIARGRKRRQSKISNILVIKDASKPECEGKVFLYSYGVKIFEKIKDRLDPSPEAIALAEQEGITLIQDNIFSFWEGKNFKIKIQKVAGYRNYDKSEFETTSTPIASTDAEIEKIWRSAYSLKAEVAPDKFKKYEELETKMKKVLGMDGSSAPKSTAGTTNLDDETPPFDADPPKAAAVYVKKTKTVEPKKATPEPVENAGDLEDDSDEMLKMFAKLANE